MNSKNAHERCRHYRRRILEISQQVKACHVGSAFSCVEIVDCIMNELMQPDDTFILSKGHGALIQYVILEDKGVLSRADLDAYCTASGRLGVHPDLGVPGVAAATGSLGHGLGMAVGMALADRKHSVYVVMSDGELQEGSSYEAVLQASSFKLNNLFVAIDNNDFQSLGRTSETHPTFYPLGAKFYAFGWRVLTGDGHSRHVIRTLEPHHAHSTKPTVLIAKTTKGKGCSFMENVPLWHYRSPNPEEYQQALKELA
jgi:transketolase